MQLPPQARPDHLQGRGYGRRACQSDYLTDCPHAVNSTTAGSRDTKPACCDASRSHKRADRCSCPAELPNERHRLPHRRQGPERGTPLRSCSRNGCSVGRPCQAPALMQLQRSGRAMADTVRSCPHRLLAGDDRHGITPCEQTRLRTPRRSQEHGTPGDPRTPDAGSRTAAGTRA